MNKTVLAIPTHLKSITDQILPVLNSHGVRRAGIFGSFACGTQQPDSDIDLLIDFPPGKTLFDLGGLYAALEDIVHRRIDLVEYKCIRKELRGGILNEEVRIL